MTRSVHIIPPLVDIRSQEFADKYELGLWWSIFGERAGTNPLDDRYLVTNLKMCAKHGYFDRQHEADLTDIGFFIGMIHGGVLSPHTLALLPDVTTLVTFHEKQIKRGYRAGREWFFNEAEPHEKRRTDTDFLERIRESITEMLAFQDSEATWNYSIGCVLGELSGQLFPQTKREQWHWQETNRRIKERLMQCQESQERNTEPLPMLEALQEA